MHTIGDGEALVAALGRLVAGTRRRIEGLQAFLQLHRERDYVRAY